MEYTGDKKKTLDETAQELFDKNYDKLCEEEKETVREIAELRYF